MPKDMTSKCKSDIGDKGSEDEDYAYDDMADEILSAAKKGDGEAYAVALKEFILRCLDDKDDSGPGLAIVLGGK